ncbi:MAG: universal stress protein [Solirubrobacterales bacterium]
MRDILLHLDGGPRSALLCEAALGLAKRFGARVTALFARVDSAKPSVLTRQASSYLLESADHDRALFTELAERAGVEARWWQLDHGDAERLLASVRLASRYADLVVVGQPDGEERSPPNLVEQIVREAGRPVLVLPRVGEFPTLGDRIVVAWNASREATRAIHDTLPLMTGAQTVSLLTIHGKGGHTDKPVDGPPVDMVEHLRRWGVNASEEHLVRDNIRDMDLLLSQACDLGADLMIMGAISHVRLRQFRSSGARFILEHMTLPTVLSH